MIIDTHANLGEFPSFNVEIDAGNLVQIMKETNIDHSVALSPINQLTETAMKEYPDKITGVYWLDPTRAQGDVYETCLDALSRGYRGFKLHPLLDGYLPDSPAVHPVMDAALKENVPVLFHSGHPPWSLPWHFGNLADVYPDVSMVLCHMGHGHIVYIDGSIDVATKHDNIYLETSGMPMHTKIKEAYDKVGAERVFFGSDAPFHHQSVEILKVKVSGLDENALEKVLYLNARELFDLDF
jgi:uncharacterized protein